MRDTGGTRVRAIVVEPPWPASERASARACCSDGGHEYLGEGGPEWGHWAFEWALSRAMNDARYAVNNFHVRPTRRRGSDASLAAVRVSTLLSENRFLPSASRPPPSPPPHRRFSCSFSSYGSSSSHPVSSRRVSYPPVSAHCTEADLSAREGALHSSPGARRCDYAAPRLFL